MPSTLARPANAIAPCGVAAKSRMRPSDSPFRSAHRFIAQGAGQGQTIRALGVLIPIRSLVEMFENIRYPRGVIGACETSGNFGDP